MQRRSFLVALSSLLGIKRAHATDGQEREPTRYLTAGRTHTLLASEVADGITVRQPEGHSVLAVDFKWYDSPEETVCSLRLRIEQASAGVYVRGSVPFSLRLDVVDPPATRIILAHRARLQVFREKDQSWPEGAGQIVLVASAV